MSEQAAAALPPSGEIGDNEATRPFQLVKHFSVTSLVIILLFSLLISSAVSRRAGDLFLKKREQYALLLAENLNHQVMTRFVVVALAEYGGINVGQPEQFKLLDAVVKNTIHSFHVGKVNILDLEGNVIYSTQPDYIGRVGDEDRPFQSAVAGKPVSVIEPPFRFFEMGGGGQRVLKTFIPLRDERRRTAELGPPRAVFEIILDISQDFREVWLNQMLILATLLVMMAVLFVILRSIVIRGQRIMSRRAALQAQLELQLNQAERLASLGRMVAGVAHEIRNPLGIVRSTAELLGSKADDAAKGLASVIVEESTRLNQIVTEFLDFARPQQLKLEPLDVEEVMDRNLRFLIPETQRLGVQVLRRYQSPRVLVLGDRDLLYRAFLNIFNNAVQAMEQGGLLTVSTLSLVKGERRYVRVAVEDSGPGIDPEAADHLLEPFFTTKEKGTGLGLSIVSNIVAGHQGKLEVNNAPGGGAQVVVLLPAAGAAH
ncbi:MAG: two-component sensor histidine kinase [Desulfarculus sp.]|nr:MAG: two-component sensor histidine kinase [Desulfarculus sp.]